jgi:hypothetical protein
MSISVAAVDYSVARSKLFKAICAATQTFRQDVGLSTPFVASDRFEDFLDTFIVFDLMVVPSDENTSPIRDDVNCRMHEVAIGAHRENALERR